MSLFDEFFYLPERRYSKSHGWLKQDSNLIKYLNVVGHSKETLNITVDDAEYITIKSIKDKLPTYVPLIDIDVRLPDMATKEIKATVENGVLILTLIPLTNVPKQIEIT